MDRRASTERRDDGDAHAVGISVASCRPANDSGAASRSSPTDFRSWMQAEQRCCFSPRRRSLAGRQRRCRRTATGSMAALKGSRPIRRSTPFSTRTTISTQTGNNEVFAAAGAKIIAHDRTRQWMANDYWIPEERRYEKARPKGAWPTQTFFNKESHEGRRRTDRIRLPARCAHRPATSMCISRIPTFSRSATWRLP